MSNLSIRSIFHEWSCGIETHDLMLILNNVVLTSTKPVQSNLVFYKHPLLWQPGRDDASVRFRYGNRTGGCKPGVHYTSATSSLMRSISVHQHLRYRKLPWLISHLPLIMETDERTDICSVLVRPSDCNHDNKIRVRGAKQKRRQEVSI